MDPETDIVELSVARNVFAYISLNEEPHRINLRCSEAELLHAIITYRRVYPSDCDELSEWIDIRLDCDMPDSMIKERIDGSVQIVLDGLSKEERREYDEDEEKWGDVEYFKDDDPDVYKV
jgi:predicted DNA-binding protein (MmcQ/YjbR family)